jgi:hypothetical protein
MEAHQAEPTPESAREQTNLDRKYGRIGISALVAALRFQGPTTARQQSQRSQQPDLGAAEESS